MTDSDIIFLAFRYCLGRMTYVVSGMCQYLLKNWDKLEAESQKMIVKEVNEALDLDRAGMDIDRDQWKNLLDELPSDVLGK